MPFLADSPALNESWGFLTIKGSKQNVELEDLSKLYSFLLGLNKSNALKVKIDSDDVTIDDLKDFILNNTPFNNWEISVNKSLLILKDSGNVFNFFIQHNKLIEWLSQLDPFDAENPFHMFSPLILFTDEVEQPIVGLSFQILHYGQSVQNNSMQYKLPQASEINKIVHSVSAKDIVIDPSHFAFASTVDSDLEKKLYILATLTMVASIVNDFYSVEKIIVDGMRRIEMKLFENSDTVSQKEYQNLLKLVSWIYEEKASTRQKLFADRITLELDESRSLVFALSQHLENSLRQAEQRYNFVILERKDKYIAELKDLLKDIRNQSDLYSQKIRTLLNNLLRDVLAAVVLVGFTLFTKFSDNMLLDKELLLIYVFNGLALYYVSSILFQGIVDITDMYVSNKEILYWKNATKELISENEFTMHIETSLKGRKRSLWIIYSLIALMYFSVAFACYKFPVYFKKISTKKVEVKNDKIPQHTTPKDSCSQGGK